MDRVDGHLESGCGDGVPIDQVEVEDGLDVGVNPSVMGRHGAEVGDVGIGVGFGRAADDLRAVRSRDEGALGVEQLEGIPLDGVVRGGEDDAPVRPFSPTAISTVGVVDSPRSRMSMPMPIRVPVTSRWTMSPEGRASRPTTMRGRDRPSRG